MSGFFRFQVSIPTSGGGPADSITNVWHFDSDQTFAEDADDTADRLKAFYDAIKGTVLSGRVGNPTVKVYDMADAQPRVPLITQTWGGFGGADGSPMPNEVAICLSFKADLAAGVNPARRRGRIFLGPIRATALSVVGGQTVVSEATRTTIVDAAVDLAKGPDPGDARLAVYSPTTHAAGGGGAGALGDAFHDVTTVWVDDACDTIRSRGYKPNVRTTGLIV